MNQQINGSCCSLRTFYATCHVTVTGACHVGVLNPFRDEELDAALGTVLRRRSPSSSSIAPSVTSSAFANSSQTSNRGAKKDGVTALSDVDNGWRIAGSGIDALLSRTVCGGGAGGNSSRHDHAQRRSSAPVVSGSWLESAMQVK